MLFSFYKGNCAALRSFVELAQAILPPETDFSSFKRTMTMLQFHAPLFDEYGVTGDVSGLTEDAQPRRNRSAVLSAAPQSSHPATSLPSAHPATSLPSTHPASAVLRAVPRDGAAVIIPTASRRPLPLGPAARPPHFVVHISSV